MSNLVTYTSDPIVQHSWCFNNILPFHFARAHKSAKVELCRYGTANTEQTQVADNNSNKSIGVRSVID